jgi:hypothetical protein
VTNFHQRTHGRTARLRHAHARRRQTIQLLDSDVLPLASCSRRPNFVDLAIAAPWRLPRTCVLPDIERAPGNCGAAMFLYTFATKRLITSERTTYTDGFLLPLMSGNAALRRMTPVVDQWLHAVGYVFIWVTGGK